MERIRIIVHGQHGEAPILAELVSALRERGDCYVDVRPTWEEGDAFAIAAEAAKLGVDVVVAAGGDGTLNEVISGIARLPKRPTVGLIPLGTANDFANAAGIEPVDVDVIVRTLVDAPRRLIDIIKVDDRFTVNIATGGFAVSDEGGVGDNLKKVFGGLAYLLKGVAKLGASDGQMVSVRGPDFEWSGAYYGLAVANARSAGGGHRVAPDALIDDGLLDIVVIPSDEKLFSVISLGANLKVEAVEEHVLRWTSPWVEITGESFALNLDGEPHQVDDGARFEVLHHHVEMCLPADTPLLSGT